MLLFILSFIVPEQNDNSSRLVSGPRCKRGSRVGWNLPVACADSSSYFQKFHGC